MALHKQGNILDVNSGFILQGCNAQGVMGSGVAKQLREKYPDIYDTYIKGLAHYDTPNKALGKVIPYSAPGALIIYNMITQEHYGKDGKKYVSYDALADALKYVSQYVNSGTPIYVPYLIGAGLGGGDAIIITAIFDRYLGNHNVTFLHHNK